MDCVCLFVSFFILNVKKNLPPFANRQGILKYLLNVLAGNQINSNVPRHAREMSELTLVFADGTLIFSVRGMKTDDEAEYWSVFDFINEVCERESSDAYGRKLFYRLIADESEHHAELISLCKYQQFKGKSVPYCFVTISSSLIMGLLVLGS